MNVKIDNNLQQMPSLCVVQLDCEIETRLQKMFVTLKKSLI